MEQSFGRMVWELRKRRKWTQEEVAERADLDQSTISAIERDIGQRTTRIVTRLAEAFGADAHEWAVLAGLLPPPKSPPPPPPAAPDEEYYRPDEIAAIVAYVEAKPGEHFRRRLARQKLLRSPEAYERLCLRLHRAWDANGDLALDAIEMAEH